MTHASPTGAPLVLTDLDDTLFATRRKQPAADWPRCSVGSVDAAGEPSGLLNPTQQRFFTWLQSLGEVVPVTARVSAQLERVRLPMGRHAVWHHGASLRLNGDLDPVWHARSLQILDPLQDLFQRLAQTLGEDPLVAPGTKLLREVLPALDGRAMQVVLKRRELAQDVAWNERVDHHLRTLDPTGRAWVHRQKDHLAILPRGITKEAAVDRLLDVLKPSLTVGCGDSASDVPFMRRCDYCVFPSRAFVLDGWHEDSHPPTLTLERP